MHWPTIKKKLTCGSKLWEAIEKVRDDVVRFGVKAYRTPKRQQRRLLREVCHGEVLRISTRNNPRRGTSEPRRETAKERLSLLLHGKRKTKPQAPIFCNTCAMLNGSSLVTEKAYIEQYKKNINVFIGIEHGMKGEEAEQQFNRLAKSSLKIAVDDTRDTGREHRASRQEAYVRGRLHRY